MKKFLYLGFILVLFLVSILSGCGGGKKGDGPSGPTFSIAEVPVPAASFPTLMNDSGTATVDRPYYMAKTEVTYELWSTVYTWATDAARGANQYYFQNAGVLGDGNDSDTATDKYPVTTVNWRDAMVWCNALTEYYNAQNGTSLVCVYMYDDPHKDPVVVRDSRDANATACDNVFPSSTAKGFRLPTSDEWELAARYIGKTAPTIDPLASAVKSMGGLYWTPGNYASGATADYNSAIATQAVAWYSANSDSSTHPVGKKPFNGNALGIYDMSGNIVEWCFDWYPGYEGFRRVWRGGCFSLDANFLQLGLPYLDYQWGASSGHGFRPVRTQ